LSLEKEQWVNKMKHCIQFRKTSRELELLQDVRLLTRYEIFLYLKENKPYRASFGYYSK
jgi:hypothetical protein